MGKRGKKSSPPEEHHKKKKSDANILDTCNNETVPEEVCKNLKKVKKEHLNEIESTEDICVSETTQNEDNQNTNRKRNKSKNKLKKSVEVTEDDIKSVAQEKNISIKPTKIRFVDDAPQVVASGSEQPTKKTKKSKKQNTQENDEEQINEEDIDNFCDELTEEDNVQFDNWVKLIEAKLHSKK